MAAVNVASAGISSRLFSPRDLNPAQTIAMFGDSLTQGAGTTGGQTIGVQLAALYTAASLPRTVYTSGLGGQDSLAIMARQGSVPGTIVISGGSIPTLGAVNVTIGPGLLTSSDTAAVNSMTCTVSGIAGTLDRASTASGGQVTFTRTAAGNALVVADNTQIIPDPAGRNYNTFLCWIGTNDLLSSVPAATMLGYIDTYLSFQATSYKRAIVILPLFDCVSASVATFKTLYAALKVLVAAKYPTNYVDTLAVLQAANDASVNDLADVAAGLVPRSLNSAVDRLHLNNTGYGVVAAAIKAKLDANGW